LLQRRLNSMFSMDNWG